LTSRWQSLTQDLKEKFGARTALEPAHGRFVLGINLGGDAVQVMGDPWIGTAEARELGLKLPDSRSAVTHLVPTPYAEPGLRQMLNTVVYRPQTLELALPLPPGELVLYLWIMENYQDHWHRLTLSIDGLEVDGNLGHLTLGTWERHGPYQLAPDQGRLELALATGRAKIDAHLMGLSLHRVA
jgi:hypothetical protein